jgi:hypothetical protein
LSDDSGSLAGSESERAPRAYASSDASTAFTTAAESELGSMPDIGSLATDTGSKTKRSPA